MIKNLIEHFKRYIFLGVLALIPVSLTVFLINILYNNIDKQIDRLLPRISGYQITWFEIFVFFFVLYLIGIVGSYVFGRKVTAKMTKKIANLFPHVQDLNTEMKLAQRIHQTMIPGPLSTERFDVAVDYIPCHIIGGDFVQYHPHDENQMTFIIGDVTGHGLPSALLSNRLHMEFETQIQKGKKPALLMRAANDFIIRAFKGTNMYFSAFCGRIDAAKMELVYSGCGFLPQYLYRRAGNQFIELESQAPMLGLMEDMQTETLQTKVTLQPQDRLILFTDGIPETVGARKKRYGTDQFRQEIKKYRDTSAASFHRSFLDDLWHFTQKEYEDDVCLMTLDIKEFSPCVQS